MLRSIESVHCAGAVKARGWLGSRRGQFCVLASCAVLAVAAAAGLLRGHAQSAPAQSSDASAPAAAVPKIIASAPPRAIVQQPTPPAGNTPEEARKREITNECADLLKMATDLKLEVDKTTKDTLSVAVVRKAGEIEQLAHKARTGAPRVEAARPAN
jgi:type VI protein secretion system component VasF